MSACWPLSVITRYSATSPASSTIPFATRPPPTAPADRSREVHEAEVLAVLARYRPNFVVLVKYLRILTSDFIAYYSNRLINIHHYFLPAFVGASPYA